MITTRNDDEVAAPGDWVVAGGRDDLDLGEILEIDGDTATVAWESGARTEVDLDDDDVEVFGSRAAAEERFAARRAADPPPVSVP